MVSDIKILEPRYDLPIDFLMVDGNRCVYL